MTELRPLLEKRGIKKSAIIDDAFDLVPRPDELTTDAWSVFFDDLTEADETLLKGIFPGYEKANREDLQASAEFVTVLWSSRAGLSKDVRDALFRDYETTSASEQAWLGTLRDALQSFGLECVTMGRETADDFNGIDLVF